MCIYAYALLFCVFTSALARILWVRPCSCPSCCGEPSFSSKRFLAAIDKNMLLAYPHSLSSRRKDSGNHRAQKTPTGQWSTKWRDIWTKQRIFCAIGPALMRTCPS